ncbi:hypothetical protein G7011_21920 [Pseudomonas plecoglossicida]|uniref:hypothetical protein n=1 Tax=Pseudomonas plecoglossicida TaxID=70775 RepID=UPI0015E41BF2|nr:hypothetical protein [Pseudomonas plecoglossicida]MBA1199772.1 hypothetical protein [Pseudomonas plecoglossicida]
MQDIISSSRITIKDSQSEYCVAGFADAYQAYVNAEEGSAVYAYWMLVGVGFLVTAVGVITMIFGPETITYNRMTGPTLFQYIQIYPGPIATIGGVCMAVGSKLGSKMIMTCESYLQANYQLMAEDGQDVTNVVKVTHLGEDKFEIALNQ